MLDLTLGILALIAGILLTTFSSEKAVEHSVIFASAVGVSPIMIGLLLVSLGTNLPEIVNSIVSSALGHGNINAGDSIGSVLTQLTLVLGLLPFFGSSFNVKRKEILIIGTCEVLALMLAASVLEKGYVTRSNALFLVGSWPLYMIITRAAIHKTNKRAPDPAEISRRKAYHATVAMLGFIGVAIGAYLIVQSTIVLSAVFKIPEYLISFFLVAIGTSLPELAVDLTAIRKKEYEIAIGDIIGSCIMDASFSIGIGQVFFPQAISGGLAVTTSIYTILASLVVISMLAVRERVDKKAGSVFIILYLSSYIMLLA